MAELVWTEELRLNQPQMDRTHEEFVELLALARCALATDGFGQGLASFERLLDHTVEHFAQEDRWMRASGFAPENCHTRQHETVLQVMREVLRLARDEARREPLDQLVTELAQWFPQHAQTMDAALAQHMADVGFDPVTGQLTGALPAAALTHCGGAGCR